MVRNDVRCHYIREIVGNISCHTFDAVNITVTNRNRTVRKEVGMNDICGQCFNSTGTRVYMLCIEFRNLIYATLSHVHGSVRKIIRT